MKHPAMMLQVVAGAVQAKGPHVVDFHLPSIAHALELLAEPTQAGNASHIIWVQPEDVQAIAAELGLPLEGAAVHG